MDTYFDTYFDNDIEYPHPAIEPLVPGTRFSYISDTFLNGWINYTGGCYYNNPHNVRAAYLITRYNPHEDNLTAAAAFNTHTEHHAPADFRDDVLLLTKDEGGKWWFYWYDRDCSDCCIGILDHSGDSDDKVLEAFAEYAAAKQVYMGRTYMKDRGDDVVITTPTVLDAAKFTGWLKL